MNVRYIGFLALIVFTTSSNAQDSKPVPAYGDFMNGCVSNLEPKGGFGSSIGKAQAESMCQCRFEHLPKGSMTKDQFFKSAYRCKSEDELDSLAFTKKYYSRIKRSPG